MRSQLISSSGRSFHFSKYSYRSPLGLVTWHTLSANISLTSFFIRSFIVIGGQLTTIYWLFSRLRMKEFQIANVNNWVNLHPRGPLNPIRCFPNLFITFMSPSYFCIRRCSLCPRNWNCSEHYLINTLSPYLEFECIYPLFHTLWGLLWVSMNNCRGLFWLNEKLFT